MVDKNKATEFLNAVKESQKNSSMDLPKDPKHESDTLESYKINLHMALKKDDKPNIFSLIEANDLSKLITYAFELEKEENPLGFKLLDHLNDYHVARNLKNVFSKSLEPFYEDKKFYESNFFKKLLTLSTDLKPAKEALIKNAEYLLIRTCIKYWLDGDGCRDKFVAEDEYISEEVLEWIRIFKQLKVEIPLKLSAKLMLIDTKFAYSTQLSSEEWSLLLGQAQIDEFPNLLEAIVKYKDSLQDKEKEDLEHLIQVVIVNKIHLLMEKELQYFFNHPTDSPQNWLRMLLKNNLPMPEKLIKYLIDNPDKLEKLILNHADKQKIISLILDTLPQMVFFKENPAADYTKLFQQLDFVITHSSEKEKARLTVFITEALHTTLDHNKDHPQAQQLIHNLLKYDQLINWQSLDQHLLNRLIETTNVSQLASILKEHCSKISDEHLLKALEHSFKAPDCDKSILLLRHCNPIDFINLVQDGFLNETAPLPFDKLSGTLLTYALIDHNISAYENLRKAGFKHLPSDLVAKVQALAEDQELDKDFLGNYISDVKGNLATETWIKTLSEALVEAAFKKNFKLCNQLINWEPAIKSALLRDYPAYLILTNPKEFDKEVVFLSLASLGSKLDDLGGADWLRVIEQHPAIELELIYSYMMDHPNIFWRRLNLEGPQKLNQILTEITPTGLAAFFLDKTNKKLALPDNFLADDNHPKTNRAILFKHILKNTPADKLLSIINSAQNKNAAEPKSWNSEVQEKLQVLVSNMKKGSNGRLTTANSSNFKVTALENIAKELNNKSCDTDADKQAVLDSILNICKQKRHKYNLFSQPHSIKEFYKEFSPLYHPNGIKPEMKK